MPRILPSGCRIGMMITALPLPDTTKKLNSVTKMKMISSASSAPLFSSRTAMPWDDGIHNAGLVHQNDNRLCQSHGESRRKHTACALAEKLTGLVGFDAEEDREDHSHDHVESGNLRERPA